MKKIVLALAAAATIAFSTLAVSTDAEAQRCRGAGCGIAIGAGILGAAIVGSAIANSGAYAYPRTYYPVAGYEPYPAYVGGPAYACPGGYWARRPVRDPYGNVVGWSRPRFFCPR
jgi:hypothetical protein